jgi:hypothetical protein
MLTRLLYTSRAVHGIDNALLQSILERSRTHNLEHGITGILCTYQGADVFLQALEGGRREVNRLYGNIIRDPRHSDITLLDYAEINERRFAGWRMGSVDLNKINRSIILRYSEKPILDAFSLTAKAALSLLEEFTSTAAIVSHDGY